jgi:prepilin-type N-terminal cleavage/methylation domain-containing protein/prepilin-type processing-associated H-X9-DG protein
MKTQMQSLQRRTQKSSRTNRRWYRGFTLIELLVVIAILGILTSLLLPAVARCKRKARAVEEMSTARQLMVAAQLYAQENDDSVFPGYVTEPSAKDDQGGSLEFPVNARYPWRLSPYLSQSFETIYCAENRRKLEDLRGLDRAGYVYAVSVFPSLGINSYFIGGNEAEFPAAVANRKFGQGTVVQKTGQIRKPSELMMFVSARSAVSGLDANGYFQVTPPQLTSRRWASDWNMDQPPAQWGFVAPRHSGRAVTAMLDGHVELMNREQLQDMRHWANTATTAEYRLQSTP